MKRSKETHIVSVLAALTALACGTTPPVTDTAPRSRDNTAELEALYRARIQSARMRFSEADVHFMTGMIGHHAQALVMAGLSPTHGANDEIQTLSARIINALCPEAWLKNP